MCHATKHSFNAPFGFENNSLEFEGELQIKGVSKKLKEQAAL